MPRIIGWVEGGIIPAPTGRALVARPASWLLCHYTGGSGPFVGDGQSDAQHMASLRASAVNAGKPYEYNYVITAPLGWTWMWAGIYQAAHCLNANNFSYGVQMNLGVGRVPNQAMIDSWLWLRAELVRTGQLAANHAVGPHYNLRTTSCCGQVMAEPPGAVWQSPSGQGSRGSLLPYMLAASTPTPPSGGTFMLRSDD